MTNTNVCLVTSQTTVQVNAASKPRDGDSVDIGMFASMMSAGMGAGFQMQQNLPDTARTGSQMTVQTDTGSYDRYQYRETGIAQADSPRIADKVTEASEELSGFEEQVVAEVAEQLGVTEDEVRTAMETLGLTAYDLMEPQNLVQLAIALTKVQDAAELLVDPQFMELMDSVGEKSQALMEQLDVPVEQKGALIAELDALTVQAGQEEVVMPEAANAQDVAVQLTEDAPVQEVPAEAQQTMEQEVPVEQEQQVPVQEAQAETEGQQPTIQVVREEQAPVQDSEAEGQQAPAQAAQQVIREEAPTEESGEQSEEPAEMAKEQAPEAKEQPKGDGEPKEEFSGRGDKPQMQTAIAKPENGAAANVQTASPTFTVEPEIPTVESSYLSIDAMDLIEQIAEQVKVNISEGSTSMEMQLNPEHLGKIYLQVTAKEGAVNAQLAATNEAVRTALEAQMAELKESLNAAGVKVDAIEVTVASHEFEQNLEQDMGREKQEGEGAEAQSSQRRSIRLDELDSLAGVMTEEEALVAQIMRDNGNSMDLTA